MRALIDIVVVSAGVLTCIKILLSWRTARQVKSHMKIQAELEENLDYLDNYIERVKKRDGGEK